MSVVEMSNQAMRPAPTSAGGDLRDAARTAAAARVRAIAVVRISLRMSSSSLAIPSGVPQASHSVRPDPFFGVSWPRRDLVLRLDETAREGARRDVPQDDVPAEFAEERDAAADENGDAGDDEALDQAGLEKALDRD